MSTLAPLPALFLVSGRPPRAAPFLARANDEQAVHFPCILRCRCRVTLRRGARRGSKLDAARSEQTVATVPGALPRFGSMTLAQQGEQAPSPDSSATC